MKLTELAGLAVWLTGCVVMTGAAARVSWTELLVTLPTELVAIAAYEATSLVVTPGSVSVVLVQPETATPFFVHWYVGVGVPEAATVNWTVLAGAADCAVGCVVIVGGTGVTTASATVLLVAEPAVLVATAA